MTTSLQALHTMRLPAAAETVCVCDSREALRSLIRSGQLADAECFLVLGEGSNVVFLSDFPGVVVLNRLMGYQLLDKTDDTVLLEVAAGESWHDCVMRCNEWGYSGIENLALIPGTVGAAPVQNIGAYGVELASVCEAVSVIDSHTGEESLLRREACCFGYRSSRFKDPAWKHLIITAVRLRLRTCDHQWQLSYEPLKKALSDQAPAELSGELISQAVMTIRRSRLPDPAMLPNAGSFFKNPIVSEEQLTALLEQEASLPHYRQAQGIKLPAAYLIEACGLKGVLEGALGTYAKHALVVVHHGGATGLAFWRFIQRIRQAVEQRFGLLLEPEVSCYHDGRLLSPSCDSDWYPA